MAKPVNHDTSSALATGWWETVKGSALGVVAAVAIGAGMMTGVGLMLGASVPILVGMATLGGVISGSFLGTPGMVVGGIGGMIRGGNKITAEKAAYQNIALARSGRREAEIQNVQMMGMQQGYAAGVQDGQQQLLGQLHQHMLMAQAGLGQQPGEKAAKIDQSRQLAAGSPALA